MLRTVARLAVVVLGATLAASAASVRVWADESPDEEIARRHYDQGVDAYAARDYGRAIKEFEAARSYRPRPELDYNLARCFDRMERAADAIDAYEAYLAQVSTGDAADEAGAFQPLVEEFLVEGGDFGATAEVGAVEADQVAIFGESGGEGGAAPVIPRGHHPVVEVAERSFIARAADDRGARSCGCPGSGSGVHRCSFATVEVAAFCLTRPLTSNTQACLLT